MVFSRMWFGMVCLATSALATQQGEGGTVCVQEEGCEATSEEQVLLLQHQVHLDGQLGLERSSLKKQIEDAEAYIGWSTFDSASETPGSDQRVVLSSPGNAIDGNVSTAYTAYASYVPDYEAQRDDWILGLEPLFVEAGDTLGLHFTESRYVGYLEITWSICWCLHPGAININIYDVSNGNTSTVKSLDWSGGNIFTAWNRSSGKLDDVNRATDVAVIDVDAVLREVEISANLHRYCDPRLRYDSPWARCRTNTWEIREVRVSNSTSTTTTTTTLTIPNNRCPLAPQVNPVGWKPPGALARTECLYNGASSVHTIVDVACGDRCQISAHLALALETGSDVDRIPAKISTDIMRQIQHISKKYFRNASLEQDRVVSTQALELVEDGLASLVGGSVLHSFMTSNGFDNFTSLKDAIATRVNSQDTVEQWEAVQGGAVDVVAAVSGPFGAGASIVSAVLSLWGMDSNKAILERIATEMKGQVVEYVASQPYEEEIARTQGYIKAFTQKLENVLATVQAIALKLPVNGGMLQYISLSALESDLAATRSEWLLFGQEAEPCNDCNSPCAPLHKAMVHIVPVLIMMHMALLQQMSLSVVSDNVLAYEAQKKFYQHAFEYYLYMRRISFGMDMFNMGCNLASGLANDTIYVCCADSGPAKDTELFNAVHPDGVPTGLGYRLLDLARLGQYRGFINETETLGEITSDPASSANWAALEGEAPTPQPGPSGMPGPGPSLLRVQEHSYSLTTMRLAQAGHAFDSPPNLQPARSTWESRYRKICGPGLACLREQISKEKVEALNMLALEVSKSLQDQGILRK